MLYFLKKKQNAPIPLNDDINEAYRSKSMFLNERVPYKQLYKNFGLQFLLFFILVLVTAGIFIAFERKAHGQNEGVIQSIHEVIGNFSLAHNISEDKIHEFIFRIDNLDDDWHKGMTYQEAFIMTLSIFFTIGWGHVLPITSGGKYFAVLISIIGIPLSFLFLVSGGQIIARHVYDLIRTVKRFLQSRSRYYDSNSSQTRVSKYLFIPTLIGLIILYIVVMSYFISKLDGFTMADSVYYSCITLFTIGFGDLHQSNMFEEDHIGKSAGLTTFIFFWLLIGLSMFASLLIVIFTFKDEPDSIGNLQAFKRSASQDDIVQNEDHF